MQGVSHATEAYRQCCRIQYQHVLPRFRMPSCRPFSESVSTSPLPAMHQPLRLVLQPRSSSVYADRTPSEYTASACHSRGLRKHPLLVQSSCWGQFQSPRCLLQTPAAFEFPFARSPHGKLRSRQRADARACGTDCPGCCFVKEPLNVYLYASPANALHEIDTSCLLAA